MSKKSLIVLSICLVMLAGVVAYVWANGCCTGDALCHGSVVAGVNSCEFYFTVDHHRQEGDQHSVKLWIQSRGTQRRSPT